MKKISISVLALAMVLGMAATASAQPEGLYFAPKIGYSHLKGKGTTTGTFHENWGLAPMSSSSSGSKGQAVLGLAVGYDFKPVSDLPLRAEFEYAWRGKDEKYSTAYRLVAPGLPTVNVTEKGKVGAQSFFVNAYFDIHNDTPVTPYIGAGLGLAVVSGEYRTSNDAGIDELNLKLSNTKTNFAWNIGAGAAWKVAENVSLDLGYRYADFGKVKDSKTIDLTGPPYNTPDLIEFAVDARATTHEVLLGLRFTF